MKDERHNEGGAAEVGGARLDAGLRVAFSEAPAAPSEAVSVLAELQSRLGGETRILLRGEGEPPGADPAPPPARSARYEVLGEIARGGMGVIIRMRDNDLGRDVAMKVLQSRHSGNRASVQRFVEEAQIAGQLQHPGVLEVYVLGLRPDGRPYFTMKLIKGRTLAAILAERVAPRDGAGAILRTFERVCQTMAYAHARGVIHRDLKPANMMVGNFGEVQLVDWGLAKVLSTDRGGGGAAESPRSTGADTQIRIPDSSGPASMHGSVMGTPAYMPPEQARGEIDELDERADVFALGAILCEILTGAPAYTGEAADMLEAGRAGDLADAIARLDACGADRELTDLARACLSPGRRGRPRDAGAVTERLSAHLASVEERARGAEVAAARTRARAIAATGLAVALAVTVVAIAFGVTGFLWAGKNVLQAQLAKSEEANAEMKAAMEALAAAKEAPVSDERPWVALRAAGARVAALQGAVDLDAETRHRASEFVDKFEQADRDRRVIERIEELVIVGATHEDTESWITMEAELRRAFGEYGIDMLAMDHGEIAARIRASELAPQLADALELWVATCGYLAGRGVAGHTKEQLLAWLDVLYEADPDPYRTEIRRQVYSEQADLDALRPLAASAEFESAMPRTLAWLGTCFLRAQDLDAMNDVFLRALVLHPADFMLNFDYAYHLDLSDRLEEAIRQYHRALALRPKNAGIWRRLGVALRKVGDEKGSVYTLDQSIRYQPQYAPTFVDLGLSRAAAGDARGAMEAWRRALEIEPQLALAHCHVGLALQAEGRIEEAVAELEQCHELGSRSPAWDQPSADWLATCRRLLPAGENR